MSASPALSEILEDEASLYEALLAVLTDEEKALLTGNTGQVADCLARKQTLTLQIRLAELSRQSTVGRLAGRDDVRLSDLRVAADPALGRARGRLLAVLPRVDQANRRVEVLLLRALSRLRTALEMIQDAVAGGRHYSAEARLISMPVRTVDGRA